MIHPIEPVQIISRDIPTYVQQCKSQGVVPMISRPNGWTEVTDAEHSGGKVTVQMLDPAYGPDTVETKDNLVITVAVYGSVKVA